MVKPRGQQTGRSILVVEDDPDLRETIALILEQHGHGVISCGDGSSAVRLAHAHHPDLALIDLDLPDLDGCEVARRIRAEGARATTRLIAVSGYAAQQDRERAQQAGFDEYLTKPIHFERLYRAIAHS